jgi:hypothetical protein
MRASPVNIGHHLTRKTTGDQHVCPQFLLSPKFETMFLSPQHARRDSKDTEYPGQPLMPGQIRLVRLLPSAWTDPIQCELFESHGSTKYEALSYVWGSQNITRSIFLNRKKFRVTFNLEGALRHLREHFKNDDQTKVFWIDALCINQKDTKERTDQVQLMGHIYKMCEQVVVYLGDRLDGRRRPDKPPVTIEFGKGETISDEMCDGDADLEIIHIFSLFQELAQQKHLTEIPAFSRKCCVDESPKNMKSKANCGDRSKLFESLRKIMHPPFTPWWSRVWVIQEVTVAPKVLLAYGTYSVPWEMIHDAALTYTSHSSSCCSEVVASLPRDQTKVFANFCSRVHGIAESRFRSGERPAEFPLARDNTPQSLLDLLRKFRDRRASDPRDKVYALLGLPRSPTSKPPLIPDYSLSEAEVFRQATLQCIYETGSLSVFSSDLGRKFRNDLPSWVPDWSAPGGPTYEARAAAAELYDAMPLNGAEVDKAMSPVGKTGLLVEALKVGTVAKVGEIMWGADDPTTWRSTLAAWKQTAAIFCLEENSGVDFVWRSEIEDLGSKSSMMTKNLRWAADNGDAFNHIGMKEFWRFVCGDIILRDQGISQVWSRVRESDELTIMMWAMNSSKSPFQRVSRFELPILGRSPLVLTGHGNGTWSTEAMIWRNILMLWPDQPVLGPIGWMENKPPEALIPHGVAGNQDRDSKISFLLQTLEDNRADIEITKNPENGWTDLPWQEILVRLRQRLSRHYGDDNLDPEAHRKLIPNIENSIMAATLSRRLIMSDRYIGLGPTGAKKGDELFFLKGGKTPFVLRETSAQPDLAGPKYELVGDCYIQGLMNSNNIAKDDPRGKWTTITLV